MKIRLEFATIWMVVMHQSFSSGERNYMSVQVGKNVKGFTSTLIEQMSRTLTTVIHHQEWDEGGCAGGC